MLYTFQDFEEITSKSVWVFYWRPERGTDCVHETSFNAMQIFKKEGRKKERKIEGKKKRKEGRKEVRKEG